MDGRVAEEKSLLSWHPVQYRHKEHSRLRDDEVLLFCFETPVEGAGRMAVEKLVKKPGLDPDWKRKLTECMKELGLLSGPFLQLTINVADFRVTDVTKQERLK
jgi:hypothetical protein